MRWKFWKKVAKIVPVAHTPENPPPFREDKRTYVCHGNNMWGNSITRSETDHSHIYLVMGWLSHAPFPRVGDELLMEMRKGGWGRFIFAETKHSTSVGDMFTGKVFGAYGLSDLEPKTKSCDEFIENLSVFART